MRAQIGVVLLVRRARRVGALRGAADEDDAPRAVAVAARNPLEEWCLVAPFDVELAVHRCVLNTDPTLRPIELHGTLAPVTGLHAALSPRKVVRCSPSRRVATKTRSFVRRIKRCAPPRLTHTSRSLD